MFFDALGRRRP